jgi:XRN 5'-3' exonuclease N-terminus
MGFKSLLKFLFTKFDGDNLSCRYNEKWPSLGRCIIGIDGNYIIYELLHFLPIPKRTSDIVPVLSTLFVSRCFFALQNISQSLNAVPFIVLIIVLDGDAPLMKRKRQLQRRRSGASAAQDILNDLETMQLLIMAIKKEIRFKLLHLDTKKYGSTKVYFSDSFQDGEGEHKLVRYILNLSSEGFCEEKILLITRDTDVIVLALLNIKLFHERHPNLTNMWVELKYKNYGSPIFEIHSLANKLDQLVSFENSSHYWFLTWLLIGNDFMPSFINFDNADNCDVLIESLRETLALHINCSSPEFCVEILKKYSLQRKKRNVKLKEISVDVFDSFSKLICWCDAYFVKTYRFDVINQVNPISTEGDTNFKNWVINLMYKAPTINNMYVEKIQEIHHEMHSYQKTHSII